MKWIEWNWRKKRERSCSKPNSAIFEWNEKLMNWRCLLRQAEHQALQWARQAKANTNLFFFMKRKDGLLPRRDCLSLFYWLWPLAATNANQINFVDLWGLHSLLAIPPSKKSWTFLLFRNSWRSLRTCSAKQRQATHHIHSSAGAQPNAPELEWVEEK